MICIWLKAFFHGVAIGMLENMRMVLTFEQYHFRIEMLALFNAKILHLNVKIVTQKQVYSKIGEVNPAHILHPSLTFLSNVRNARVSTVLVNMRFKCVTKIAN